MAKIGRQPRTEPKSAQVIDWNTIRGAAITFGVREAARRAGANLTITEQRRLTNRILKRSQRERWVADLPKSARTEVPTSDKPLSAAVISSHEIFENALRENSNETKRALSVAGRNAAEHLAKMKAPGVIKRHHALRNITSAMSDVHGWAEKGSEAGPQLNVLNIQVDARSVTVNRSGNSSGDV